MVVGKASELEWGDDKQCLRYATLAKLWCIAIAFDRL
jgi:hypothetical protein